MFNTFISPKVIKGTAGLLCVLAIWQISIPLVGVSSYFYPAPLDVWNAFIDLMTKGILISYLVDSLTRYSLGVLAGTIIGITLGIAIGLNKLTARVFSPIINFFFAIVESAWIPLFVVWFGFGFKTIMGILIYVVAFPVLYNTLSGVRTVPVVYVNAARSLGATNFQVIFQIIVPSILPSIVTGFRVGAGFAFRGLIIAEMIAGGSGIGFLIFEGTANKLTDRTIVGMLTMGAVWLFIDLAYLRPFERSTIERWRMVTTAEDRS